MSFRRAKAGLGLPDREEILSFISKSDSPVGKREIAKAFRLKGSDKISLKKLLKDMTEEGLLDGNKSAFHRMGGIPKVTILRVCEINDDEVIAKPDKWSPEASNPPPKILIKENRSHRKGRTLALGLQDRVLARTEDTTEGWTAYVIKRLPPTSDGLLGVIEIDSKGTAWLAPIDKRVRFSTKVSSLGGAVAGQLVLGEKAGRSDRSSVNITKVIGDPLKPKNFSLIAIAKHGIPHIFPEEAIEEATLAAKLTLNEEHRDDLRHLPFIAIDPPDARDHDDAIWAQPDGDGHFDAAIAIADVSYYVRAGSHLDKEARRRGNSVYFPDRVVPMLPEILSSDVCSLKAGQDRAAIVCHLKFDSNGSILKKNFRRALVNLKSNFSYEVAQSLVINGDAPKHLSDLWAAWIPLRKARIKRDPLELDLPERRVFLNEDGLIDKISIRDRLDAHLLVEDFMIAANVAAAQVLEQKNSPVVYRVHESPSREKLIALRDYLATFDRKLALGQVITPSLFNTHFRNHEDDGERVQIMEAILRSQMQAYYSPTNNGHFGLSLASYAHFTSPIRRYSDLLIHRALNQSFDLEQPKPSGSFIKNIVLSEKDNSNLKPIADAISQTERRAMEAERETTDRYMASWLSNRIGDIFETRITGVQSFGFFATILDLGGDGLVPISTLGDEHFWYSEKESALIGEDTGKRYAVGDRIELKLAEANKLTGSLKFVPVEASIEKIDVRGRFDRKSGKGRGQTHIKLGRSGRPRNIRHQTRRKRY